MITGAVPADAVIKTVPVFTASAVKVTVANAWPLIGSITVNPVEDESAPGANPAKVRVKVTGVPFETPLPRTFITSAVTFVFWPLTRLELPTLSEMESGLLVMMRLPFFGVKAPAVACMFTVPEVVPA